MSRQLCCDNRSIPLSLAFRRKAPGALVYGGERSYRQRGGSLGLAPSAHRGGDHRYGTGWEQARGYALALPRADDVFLIIEVADTALRYDREIKLPLYARHGIPEVWLIDVEERTLTIFEAPQTGGIATSAA